MKPMFLFAAVLAVLAALAAAGCAGGGAAPGSGSGSSGIEVFGTIDASVSRTRDKP